MKNQIVLSICIPTYNQPQDLRRTLSSIVSQISSGEIEVIIGDNSTNSETEHLVKRDFDLPYLHYFRYGKNLGSDRNILLITGNAKGQYIWWFGDDKMRPGAINYILNIIKKNSDLSLIWVNVVNLQVPGGVLVYNFSQDKLVSNKNQVLEEISDELTFISSIVFRKDKILNVNQKNMNQFIGSGFVNLYLVMHILSQGGKFYYISYPYIIYHPTPAGRYSYDRFQVFGINFFKVVMNFKDKFDGKPIKRMLTKNFSRLWRWVLVGWLEGYSTPRGKLWPMFKLYWNFSEFWLAAPFFLMPKFVIKFIYFLETAIRKFKKKITQID